uniref:MARVEL domain-containing protein n=1 Tax=Plectus sambesii TaxID=2011161 RepID=A0A914UUR8_9BILA
MGGRRQGYSDYNDYGGGQFNGNRYDMDNVRNKQQMRAANGRNSPYAPVPTAVPTMGITINQNSGPVVPQVSPYAVTGRGGGVIPSAPPSYHDDTFLWLDRFPRRENRGMFRLCLVEALLGVVILGGGIWCYRDTAEYCPYYSAIWTSVLYLLNAIAGSAAAKVGTINLYMAHLVLSLVNISICAVSAGLSARNWALVGTYHHPRIERDEAFCLLGEHDTTRISYIFSHLDQYDFPNCLWQLKVGVAVNSVQFVIAGIEAFLNIISAFMCCKRTCTTCITIH